MKKALGRAVLVLVVVGSLVGVASLFRSPVETLVPWLALLIAVDSGLLVAELWSEHKKRVVAPSSFQIRVRKVSDEFYMSNVGDVTRTKDNNWYAVDQADGWEVRLGPFPSQESALNRLCEFAQRKKQLGL